MIFPYNSLYTQAVAYNTYFELGEPVLKDQLFPGSIRKWNLQKKEQQRAERKWRKTRLQSDFLDFKTKKNQVTYSIKRARIDHYSTVIQKNKADQHNQLTSEADLTFQGYHNNRTLANDIGKFFVQKLEQRMLTLAPQ